MIGLLCKFKEVSDSNFISMSRNNGVGISGSKNLLMLAYYNTNSIDISSF